MRSEAQRKADKKYRESEKNNYTTISAGMTKEQAEIIKNEAKKRGITASKFLLSSVMYCIENEIEFNSKEN